MLVTPRSRSTLGALTLVGTLALTQSGCFLLKGGSSEELDIDVTAALTMKGEEALVKLTIKAPPGLEVHVAPWKDYRSYEVPSSGELVLEGEHPSPGERKTTFSVTGSKTEKRLFGLKNQYSFGQGQATVEIKRPWKYVAFDRGYLKEHSAECVGDEGPRCKIEMAAGELRVTAPAGTTIEHAGQTFKTLNDTQAVAVKLPDDWMSKNVTRIMTGPPELKLPYKIKFPTGQTAAAEVTYSVSSMRTALLEPLRKSVNKVPVALPGDDPAPPAPRALAYFAGGIQLIGKPRVPAEVDLVAITTTTTRERSCGTYTSSSGAVSRAGITFTDKTVTVIDRRTGAVKHTKRYTAPPMACPSTFSGKPGQNAYWSSTAESNEHEWLKTLVPAEPPGPPPGAAAPTAEAAPAADPAAPTVPATATASTSAPTPAPAPPPTAKAPTPAPSPPPTAKKPPPPPPPPTPTVKKPPVKKPTLKK
jgi:hypothetical protein